MVISICWAEITSRFAPCSEVEDYYLLVGRLVPYRRIDLLIEAFNKMKRPLRIAGTGRDRARLEALAGPTVEFLGYVPDEELPSLLAKCRAFMFPGEEDFGIAPIQAMAAGRPVIAYAAGGALETVIDGVTGTFFAEQTIDSIIQAVEGFDTTQVEPQQIRQHAQKFDTALFKAQILNLVEAKLRQNKEMP